jgi:hypothetical protein
LIKVQFSYFWNPSTSKLHLFTFPSIAATGKTDKISVECYFVLLHVFITPLPATFLSQPASPKLPSDRQKFLIILWRREWIW